MTAAAAPQTALQNQVATDQSQLAAYQAVNTKLAAVQTAAQALARRDTWNATTATSSSSTVVATGSTSAQPGSFTTFSVLKVATAQVTTVAVSGAAVADPNAGIDVVGGGRSEPPHRPLRRHRRRPSRPRSTEPGWAFGPQRSAPTAARSCSSPRPGPGRPARSRSTAWRARRRTWSRPRTPRSRWATRPPAVTPSPVRPTRSPTPSPASRSRSARRPPTSRSRWRRPEQHQRQRSQALVTCGEQPRSPRSVRRRPGRRAQPVTPRSSRCSRSCSAWSAAGTSTGGSFSTYGVGLTSTGTADLRRRTHSPRRTPPTRPGPRRRSSALATEHERGRDDRPPTRAPGR